MLLSVVTDDELFASQIVKTIFLIILSSGIIYYPIRFFRTENRKIKIISAGAFIVISTAFYIVFNAFRIEGNLLNSAKYTSGTTLGYCTKPALGEGVEFEYEVNGKKYSNCNTYHPISKDSIKVPNGKYKVRYSEKFPESGRMDFHMQADDSY